MSIHEAGKYVKRINSIALISSQATPKRGDGWKVLNGSLLHFASSPYPSNRQ
jgi:hypothetical protein